jgi:hypothetical protein
MSNREIVVQYRIKAKSIDLPGMSAPTLSLPAVAAEIFEDTFHFPVAMYHKVITTVGDNGIPFFVVDPFFKLLALLMASDCKELSPLLDGESFDNDDISAFIRHLKNNVYQNQLHAIFTDMQNAIIGLDVYADTGEPVPFEETRAAKALGNEWKRETVEDTARKLIIAYNDGDQAGVADSVAALDRMLNPPETHADFGAASQG